MDNIEMKVDGNVLTIKVDLSKDFGKSSTGKSTIIATSKGNQTIEGTDDVKIGLNIYKKAS